MVGTTVPEELTLSRYVKYQKKEKLALIDSHFVKWSIPSVPLFSYGYTRIVGTAQEKRSRARGEAGISARNYANEHGRISGPVDVATKILLFQTMMSKSVILSTYKFSI